MRYLVFACLCSLLTLAQAAEREPFANVEAIHHRDEQEQRVWSASDEFEVAINKSGQVYASKPLNQYLQSVMDTLYPEFVGHIKVRAVNSPLLNAFAIPNGNIYINIGLLTRCENEAQLATILAHEGAHFIYRHGYYQQQSVKGSAAFGTVTAILGVPIVGLLGNAIAVNSIFGYSRELETEADNMGFKRLQAAGYDVSEASKVFMQLLKETKLSEKEESSFYSTHPKLQDRINNFEKLAKTAVTQGVKNDPLFTTQTQFLLIEGLELELSFGRYKYIIQLLEDAQTQRKYPPQWRYYLAEAYRKRNEKNDVQMALVYLDQAIQQMPDFALSYRAKGMVLMSQSYKQEAEKMFKRYLELLPQANDKSYIESYLETLKI